ncbi:16S rRNA methyltransferase B family protein [Bordetella bronchiseptica CA90 BB1334]|nr:16S rRNA methyltransferase B family protein [Bordetella bronchiseptica CA90 BB1334]
MQDSVAERPAARWNHPRWWVELLERAYPDQWRGILAGANVPAPLTLRVNRRRATVEQARQALAQAGVAAAQRLVRGRAFAQPHPAGRRRPGAGRAAPGAAVAGL